MDRYSVTFARSARKELESLPSHIIDRILGEVEKLAHLPFPSGCKKLKGTKNLWRIRVGDYRVIYFVFTRELVIDVVRIRHRKEAYN